MIRNKETFIINASNLFFLATHQKFKINSYSLQSLFFVKFRAWNPLKESER